MGSVLSRWTARLSGRRKLLASAEASVRYWAKRAGSVSGRRKLEEAVAKRKLRRGQVEEAEKVVARHSKVTGMSDEGVAFVAGLEGFRANVYRDAVGVLTQGYGETKGITPGRPWTRAYALSRLRQRLNQDYLAPVLAVADGAGLELSQKQADALGSLSYNLGPGVFQRGRTMGDAIRSKDHHRIADAFLVYDKAGGQALPGLTRRRRAERAMYLEGTR